MYEVGDRVCVEVHHLDRTAVKGLGAMHVVAVDMDRGVIVVADLMTQ